jgi:hypothetical protein
VKLEENNHLKAMESSMIGKKKKKKRIRYVFPGDQAGTYRFFIIPPVGRVIP